MKKKNLAVLAFMAVCMGIVCSCSKDDEIVDPENGSGSDNHEYVNLALPSGTLWATCNVGANSPEEYGDYFAWGETEPKNNYSWGTYSYGSSTMTKYCSADGKTKLDAMDDAATAKWGSRWQMPNLTQIKELYNSSYTTTIMTTQNGTYGCKITSKSNGKSIFLPAAGSYLGGTTLSFAGSRGYYWSQSRSTDSHIENAYNLGFDSEEIYWDYDCRCYGFSIRPVRK